MNSHLVSQLSHTRHYDLSRRAAERHAIRSAPMVKRPARRPTGLHRLVRTGRFAPVS